MGCPVSSSDSERRRRTVQQERAGSAVSWPLSTGLELLFKTNLFTLLQYTILKTKKLSLWSNRNIFSMNHVCID